MGQVEIGAKISVDAGSAASKVLELKESVKQLSEEFKNSKEGSDEQKDAFIRLQQAQNDLKSANKELQSSISGTNDAAKEGKGHFEELKSKVTIYSGLLIKKIASISSERMMMFPSLSKQKPSGLGILKFHFWITL
jgi:chromosome segregation ATPase